MKLVLINASFKRDSLKMNCKEYEKGTVNKDFEHDIL